MTEVLKLCQKLIACPSVTPEDAGCQSVMIDELKALGFEIHPLNFGNIQNFWAQRGQAKPLMVFAGHTDVVPVGDETEWTHPPFQPTVENGYLYGRGTADMKGSLAAMLIATKAFLKAYPNHEGSIGFLITGDEEGPAIEGTVKVIEYLKQHSIQMDYCIVGEPSSASRLGDTLKVGRRGSLNGKLKIHGIQGHVAYPEKADNPIHKSLGVLKTLCEINWDQGSEFFPPTSFQISNIHSGTGVTNVIPASIEVLINWRFSNLITADEIKTQVQGLLEENNIKYDIEWVLSGSPFLTQSQKLISVCSGVIESFCGIKPELSTSGGTSDARFIAPTGCEVVELGPCNQTIHQVNECIAIQELEDLVKIYEGILQQLLVID